MKNYYKTSPAWLAYKVSNAQFKCPKHISYLDSSIISAIKRGNSKLIVNMPPRHGKSEYISKYLPFWHLCNFPEKRIILTSYEANFAASWGRKVRDLINEFGKPYFSIEIDDSNRSVSSFGIKGKNGFMQCVGAGGAITGKGADLLIIDDPVKNDAEANSKTYRDNLWEWFRATALTRLEPRGNVILVMTRWHEDDLCGRISENLKTWKTIKFPAISEQNDAIRSRAGISLWSERYSIQELKNIKLDMGEYWFSALYQQEPAPSKGGIFKKKNFKYYKTVSEFIEYDSKRVLLSELKYFTVVDLAVSSSETSDYTVILTFGIDKDKNIFIIDVEKERFSGAEHLELLKRVYFKYKPIIIGIEAVQYQISLVQRAIRESLPVIKLIADKDKVTRALPVSALMDSKRVFFPANAIWLHDFESELLSFPTGKHDDQVDAFAYIHQLIYKYSLGFKPVSKSYRNKENENKLTSFL